MPDPPEMDQPLIASAPRPARPVPTICVVIPTFNRSTELVRALQALADQTDPDFDVVVCDDGSTEDVRPAVQQFARRLRVALIRIENSGGPARPRNVAAAATEATWISFLDSDDWWASDRMARVREALVPEVDVVYHQLRIHRQDGATTGPTPHGGLLGSRLRGTDAVQAMVRFGNAVPTSACTVRRNLLQSSGGFCESRALASVEDFDAWLRLAAAGVRFHFLDAVLGCYWVGQDNISEFTPRQFERQKTLFERQLTLLPARYRPLADSHFHYLLGCYALTLDLPGAESFFDRVTFAQAPTRWLKARWKLLRSKGRR